MSHPPVNQRSQVPAGPAHSPRSGAHRPRRPLWHDILPAVAVLVAVLAVVFAFFQLKDSVLGTASTSSSGPSDPGPDDQQSAAPTAPVTTSPTTTPTTKPTATSTPSSAAPTVNRKASITVLNSTSRSGLAKGAASKLDAAGWNASSGGNQSFSGSTTVFYSQARLEATAKAIAKDLGGYPVKQSTAYGSSGVFVILGNDYSR